MKIGIIQTNSGHDVDKNIADLRISLASVKTADLVITPECTNLMGFDGTTDQLMDEKSDPCLNFLREWSAQNQTRVLAGSILIKDADKGNINRQYLIDTNGEIMTRYDKIHMFDVTLANGEVYKESARFAPGDQGVVSHIDKLAIGHSICFDVRFPKLYRALAQNGANVLVVPAAFSQTTGRAHWEILLRARAIENGAFVIAPAQTGSYVHHDGSTRYCHGHSMVISPWGEVIADLGNLPSTKIVDVNLSLVDRARNAVSAYRMEREFVI